MNKNKLIISFRIFVTACAALGWWGVLYPELTMTPDTYRVVYEDSVDEDDTSASNREAVTECEFDNDIYETVLGAERSQIRFRSRLLMEITTLYE